MIFKHHKDKINLIEIMQKSQMTIRSLKTKQDIDLHL